MSDLCSNMRLSDQLEDALKTNQKLVQERDQLKRKLFGKKSERSESEGKPIEGRQEKEEAEAP